MFRNLMKVAMVATLMLGSVAWAVNLDVDVNNPARPDLSTTDVLIDGAGVTANTHISTAGIVNGGTVANTDPYVIQKVTIGHNGANGTLYIGATAAGAQRTAANSTPVWARIGTLVFETGANPATATDFVAITSVGRLSVTNAVDVTLGSVRVMGGQVDFDGGAKFTATGANNGTLDILQDPTTPAAGVAAGSVYEAVITSGDAGITLGSAAAMTLNSTFNGTTNANYRGQGLNVDATEAKFIVDSTSGTAVANSAITWTVATNVGTTLETIDLAVGSLAVNQGALRLGQAGTVFTSVGPATIGGEQVAPATTPPTYKAAITYVDNANNGAAATVNFDTGVTIKQNGTLQSNIATAGQIARMDVGTNGTEKTIGHVVLAGVNDGTTTGNTGGTLLQAVATAPMLIVDWHGGSEIQLLQANNVMSGIIDTARVDATGNALTYDRMDMTVAGSDMYDYNLRYANANSPARAELIEGTKNFGDSWLGIAGSGDVTNEFVGNYKQFSGGLFSDEANDYLTVLESFNVSGGYYGANTHAYTNMSFNGTAATYKDVVHLYGMGQVVQNQSHVNTQNGVLIQAAATPSTWKKETISIGANAIHDLDDAGMTIRGMSTVVDAQGDVLFGVNGAANNVLTLDTYTEAAAGTTAGMTQITYSATNSGSVKFTEDFLKTVHTPKLADVNGTGAAVLIDKTTSTQAALITVDVEDADFWGLHGDFWTSTFTNGNYGIFGYQTLMELGYDRNLDYSGSADDVATAHAVLNNRWGHAASKSFGDAIYRSVSENYVAGDPYERLRLEVGATEENGVIDQFNTNFANLQHFAAGRPEASSAMNAYNGNSVNGVNMVSQAVARSHIRTAMNRSDEIRETYHLARNTVEGSDALAASIMNACYTNRVWVGGFGLWEDADSRHGMAGYKYKSGGFVVGYDRLIGTNFIIGGSFAYNTGDFEDKSAVSHDSDIDNYSFNLYGTYTHCSGFFGTLFGGYTYSDNDIGEGRYDNLNNYVRNNADYHTNTWTVGAKFGYDWKPTERFYITPSVGFTYIHAVSSSHNESFNSVDQNVTYGRYGKMKDKAAYIPVEVNIGYDAWVCNDKKLNLNLNVGYAYNFDEDGVEGTVHLNGFEGGLAYRANTREQGHHLFNVGGGATFTMGRFDVGVKYDYYRQADANTHRVLGTVGLKF